MSALFLTKAQEQILLHTFLFQGMESIPPIFLTKGAILCRFEKNETIYSRTVYKEALGILLKGRVAVKKDSGNRKTFLLNELSKGDTFGGASLFQECSSFIADIVSLSACEVLFLNKGTLSALFHENILFAENYITYLSNALQFLNHKIDTLCTQDRLFAYLCSVAQADDCQTTSVTLPFSYSQLANRLNISRASLYRELGALERSGRIKKEHKKIIITEHTIKRS